MVDVLMDRVNDLLNFYFLLFQDVGHGVDRDEHFDSTWQSL